ncbi:MAG: hypothetical protein NC924_05570 [Candidatus Omnitrophica bacterium]|nr:hypothetical protein [Candidatus Omnitrophota bacterium]
MKNYGGELFCRVCFLGVLLTAKSIFAGPIAFETTSRAINIDNTMTTAEIQSAFDAVGRYIPDDVVITFQFADGTYTLNNALVLDGFYGGGEIII